MAITVGRVARYACTSKYVQYVRTLCGGGKVLELCHRYCLGRTEPHMTHGGEWGCMELMGYMGLNGAAWAAWGCMGCMEPHELQGAAWSCKQLNELHGSA
eukprot:365407-Chlamydomonas_euryale.AAC.1